MKHRDFPYGLYLVLSNDACVKHSYLEVAEAAMKGGVDIIQLREKRLTTDQFLTVARPLKALTDQYHVPLIINDNLEVAKQLGAYGIHVGNNDLPPTYIRKEWPSVQHIGYSIEYLHQLSNMETAAASALAASPVFSTATKTDTVTEWGLEGIRTLRALTTKPLIAIGNISGQNAAAVLQAGANSLAVVSAICGADDPETAARKLKTIIDEQL